MRKQTDQQPDRDAALDSAIERLRHQRGVFKTLLTGKDFVSSLEEVDRATEELINEVFGSSSDIVEAYTYAQIGEAASIMYMPHEAPETGSQDLERESLQQRIRVLESGLSDLEARRAEAKKGRTKLAKVAKVADYMAKVVRTVSADATLEEAGRLMQEWKVGSLLVEDGGEYVGVISETELSREVVARRVDPVTSTVKTCMREPIVSVASNEPIVDAVFLMKEKATRHLAVTENGTIIGVISVSDILRYYSGVV